MTVKTEFKIGKVDQTKVFALTKKLKDHWKKTAQEIIEVGKCLHELKEILPRSQFVSHVHTTIGISEKHAMRIIEVYRRFGKAKSIALIKAKPTVLYHLAYSCNEEQISQLIQGKKIKTASGYRSLSQINVADVVRKKLIRREDFERQLATFFEEFQDDLLDYRKSIKKGRKLQERQALKETINETIACLENFNSLI